MTNPTHTSRRTYVCMGCKRGFRKRRLEARYHAKDCLYFAELDENGVWHNDHACGGYIDSCDMEYQKEWWEQTHQKSPDWSGEPEFYERTSIDGKDTKLMKAVEVARKRKEGLAR